MSRVFQERVKLRFAELTGLTADSLSSQYLEKVCGAGRDIR
jgi:hypothetical protein